MKNLVYSILIILVCMTLSSCAVGMALHGKPEPEISDIQPGMPMDEVHFIMRDYTPAVNYVNDIRTEVYTIEIGNEPSAGRALGHLAMDALTWGAWEIIGTPLEAIISKSMTLTISYTPLNTRTGIAFGEDYLVVDTIKAGKLKGGI